MPIAESPGLSVGRHDDSATNPVAVSPFVLVEYWLTYEGEFSSSRADDLGRHDKYVSIGDTSVDDGGGILPCRSDTEDGRCASNMY